MTGLKNYRHRGACSSVGMRMPRMPAKAVSRSSVDRKRDRKMPGGPKTRAQTTHAAVYRSRISPTNRSAIVGTSGPILFMIYGHATLKNLGNILRFYFFFLDWGMLRCVPNDIASINKRIPVHMRLKRKSGSCADQQS